MIGPDSVPTLLAANGDLGDTGVDEWASAVVDLGGLTASVHTSIRHDQVPRVIIHGSAGAIDLPSIWGSRTDSGTELELRTVGEPRTVRLPSIDPMAAEADAISTALADGRREVPAMTWTETLLVADVLDAWRAALD